MPARIPDKTLQDPPSRGGETPGACVLVAGGPDRESISEKARVREKKNEKIVSFMNLAWNGV